jgi:hypothetical protein
LKKQITRTLLVTASMAVLVLAAGPIHAGSTATAQKASFYTSKELARRPYAAFGNSTGDQQMLEYTKAGDGARLSMLVLHDDAKREYA